MSFYDAEATPSGRLVRSRGQDYRSRYRRAHQRQMFWVVVGIIALLFAIGTYTYFKDIRESTVTFTVTGKTAAGGGSNGHKYLFYTNNGTYQDSDNLFYGKFASSDLYGQIRVGQTYTCKVTGFRIPLFSSYKNVISCDPAQRNS